MFPWNFSRFYTYYLSRFGNTKSSLAYLLMISGIGFDRVPSFKPKDYDSDLTIAAKIFMKNVRNYEGDDRLTLELTLQIYNEPSEGVSKNKMRSVMNDLEASFMKNKSPVSDGLIFSLCIITLVSRAFAENYMRKSNHDNSSYVVEATAFGRRQDALTAMFSLIKTADRKGLSLMEKIRIAADLNATTGEFHRLFCTSLISDENREQTEKVLQQDQNRL